MRRVVEARLVFRLANSVRTPASRASACVTLMRNGSGSISSSASPALTRWPSVTVTLGDLAGDVRRDEHLLRAHIGVVGRDVAAGREIEIARRPRARSAGSRPAARGAAARARRAAARHDRRRRDLFLRLPQFDDFVGHDALLRPPPRFSPRAFCAMAAFRLSLVCESSPIMRSIVATSKPFEHGPHHVLAELGEPVHQRARERGEMQALGAAVVRVGAALDHARSRTAGRPAASA